MIRKAGLQEPIGYDPQAAKQDESGQPAAEIGCVPQKPSQPAPDGLSPEQILKLEAMSEPESFAFLDELTAPHTITAQVHGKSCK